MAGDAPKTSRRRSGTHRNPRRFGGLHPATWAAGVLVFLVVLLAALELSNGNGDNNNAAKALPDSSPSAVARTTSPPATAPAPVPSVPRVPPAPSVPPAPRKPPPPPAINAPPQPPAAPRPQQPQPQRQPPRPAPPGPGVPWVIYVVGTGDTMWGITDWALGSRSTPDRIAASWAQIWSANRSVIGDNPNLIFPGQRFRVPRIV